MSEETKNNSGIGILELIFVVFLFLKLGEFGSVANWSWWWITAPIWISILLRLIIAFIIYKLQQYNSVRNITRQSAVIIGPKVKNNEIPTPEEIKKYKKEKLSFLEKIKLWFKSFRKNS